MSEPAGDPGGRLPGAERQRLLLMNRTPRYGNDDPVADEIMQRLLGLS